MTRSLPRDLHPVSWWLWAIGLAAASTYTTNPLLLLLLAGVVAVMVTFRRSNQPWGRSFRLYCWLALAVVTIRVIFRIVFGGVDVGTVILQLPEIPLPDWVAGVRLLGPVTLEGLLAGLYDGLRLALLVLCFGAANSLANPKRLLKSVPPALYEVGTALVIAVTVFPQLAESARRVRAAQALRGGPDGRIRGLRRLLVPVLEDALERSLALAAGMDARGYGRTPGLSRRSRAVTGTLLLAGLCGLGVGSYAVLDLTAPRWMAAPMLLGGLLCAVAGLAWAGRRVRRTRYRPDRWGVAEIAVVGSGLGVAALAWQLVHRAPSVAYPALDVMPTIDVLALAIVGVALLPLALTPAPAEGA